jgi:GNAT superfamily N-acetyltransferase
MHPLLPVLVAAAEGRFPAVDGAVEYLAPLDLGLEAVVAFTGHAFIASRLGASDFPGAPPDGFGAALDPSVLLRMAGAGGTVGSTDVGMVSRGVGGGMLPRRADLYDHPRVRHAISLRRDVHVFGDERGLVTLATGLAGRLEMSVEAAPDHQGSGVGTSLVLEALALVPAGEPVFAAVAPGNARSLRAFLRVGFTPIGSETIVRPPPQLGKMGSVASCNSD